MEEVDGIHEPQLDDDLPVELIHRIQSMLPAKEAARTCVLSKSWLDAWSTRTLSFRPPRKLLSTQQLKTYTDLINLTLQKYHVHNIPITSFDLHFRIINHESLCFVNNWVHTVASTSCLKELYLTLSVLESITLPNALFSGENLDTISVKSDPYFKLWHSLLITNNHVIKCVKLRVLEMINVTFSDKTLIKLLSTCIFLEKINLSSCKGLIWDDAYSSTISKLRFLDSLIIHIDHCKVNIMDISSVSLKKLTVHQLNTFQAKQINIKIDAPKLNNFRYKGTSVPGLMFLSTAPGQIKLTLNLSDPIDHSFFLKIRELLNLSSNFKIKLSSDYCCNVFTGPINSDEKDTRRRVQIPAMNVERLTFKTNYSDEGLWNHPQLIYEEIISNLCPNYLTVQHMGFICVPKLIAKVMMEMKTRKHEYRPYLKKVEIKNRVDGKWITVTSSWITSPELAYVDSYRDEFKLTWSSL